MPKLSNREIRDRISKLHSKKENLIGRKEELLKTYMEVCENTDYSMNDFIAGYGNTTSAVEAIQFKYSSGNIDAGTIKLYGVT